MKIEIPKYQQIAEDIASKIAYGEYSEGEKIYVRSSLASQYGVSSETARRALCVLADMKIVDVTKGSGVIIKSRKRAKDFINRLDSINQMGDLRTQIMNQVEQQITSGNALKAMISDLMYKTEHFRSINPFLPFEIAVTDKANFLGQSLSECNFWHNTTATIIAIRRDDQIIISPGPYATILSGDIIYFIGDENCNECVKNFLYAAN